jgi:hypothetical protein
LLLLLQEIGSKNSAAAPAAAAEKPTDGKRGGERSRLARENGGSRERP